MTAARTAAMPVWLARCTRPGLRRQLLLVTLCVLVVLPLLHLRYVAELHRTLQETQRHALLDVARAYAAALELRAGTATAAAMADQRLDEVFGRDGRQVWLLDPDLHELRRWGALVRRDPQFEQDTAARADWIDRLALNALHPLLHPQPPTLADVVRDTTPVIDDAVRAARQGSAGLRVRPGADAVPVFGAVVPLWSAAGEVRGVLLVEQGSEVSGRIAEHLRERLLLTTLLGFGVMAAIFMWYAGRLVGRILRLQQGAEQAHDRQGRLRPETLPVDEHHDEIGRLSRSIADMLRRLDQQHGYLLKLARLLTHELRTPIAMIRSSLENLTVIDPPPQDAVYFERAQRGIDRINLVLSAMSEASVLDEQLLATPRIGFDLAAFLRDYVEAFACSRPDRIFETRISPQPLSVTGHPEWAAQLMDKLLSNACDFVTPGTPIVVEAATERAPDGEAVVLRVCNQGPALDPDKAARLFEPFASDRRQPREPGDDQPHLGIGLHVARLIARYHDGRISARNATTGDGVVFEVRLPAEAPAR